jgi:hypothetical protein
MRVEVSSVGVGIVAVLGDDADPAKAQAMVSGVTEARGSASTGRAILLSARVVASLALTERRVVLP